MAKKRKPEFNLPSTNVESSTPKTDWVYRSEAPAAAGSAAAADATPIVNAAAPAVNAAAPEVTSHEAAAHAIVASYAKYAATAGAIPIPFLDFMVITGVQVKMLSALAAHYHLSSDEQLAKSMIAASITSMGATRFAYTTSARLMKSVPGIGTAGAIIAMPLSAYALTWTLGQLFASHFAKGGTLFDFKPASVRA
ncbi:MAG: DUF697 domain-containing protein [Acidimicrobiia bacterium]|nr:DUF697 domain-containing protein [Acidimicrobiia bacterium]